MATATTTRPAGHPAPGGGGAPPGRMGSPRDLAKFTGLVALFAIFADAAVGHGLLWENDPYWTYWVTKTFLIATVFGLGTAWAGTGIGRGAAITAVHTVVLTVYYWSLSPLGLPSHPTWLDLEHTWVTGVPVHFGVIYLGYLAALWLWQRRPAADGDADAGAVAGTARDALLAGLAIVVVGGALSSIALMEFPGATWFVVRLLLAVPFALAWWALAGRDRTAAVVGGTALALVFVTYGHFVGPVGLPDLPLRVFDQGPPGATASWPSYRDLWLVELPIFLVVSIAVFLLAADRGARPLGAPARRRLARVAAVAAVAVLAAGGWAFAENGPGGDRARVVATGAAQVEEGPFYGGTFRPTTARLTVDAAERNPRVTPLPPHDLVSIRATVEAGGTTYEVVADQPLVDDPLGRHGTWWGVGLDAWHHGESGLGTTRLPAVHSEVAVFGVGRVLAGGREIAVGVPVHVMTSDSALPGRVELDVGDEEMSIPGLPDGHLRVVWEDYEGGADRTPRRARNLLGTVVLLGLLALVVTIVRAEEPGRRS